MSSNSRLERAGSAVLSSAEARQLGHDAFVFGFPLLLTAATMRHATNVIRPTGESAPLNQFAHIDRFADPAHRAIVAANADTLYSLAWFDLAAEPVVLDLPDTEGRSYLVPLIDGWTDLIACLGPRNASAGHAYGIVGPGWEGDLPDGVRRIDSHTNLARTICHLHAFGPDDREATGDLQRKLTLTPLSSYGNGYTPADKILDAELGLAGNPHRQLMAMKGAEFLGALADAMKEAPLERDGPLLARLTAIDLHPSVKLEWDALPEQIQEALEAGLLEGKRAVDTPPPAPSPQNGWHFLHNGLDSYGTDYLQRAQVANLCLGSPQQEDATFPVSMTSRDGTDGSHLYAIRFEKGELPPVGALWSLAIYDSDQLVVRNEIDRYALGDRDEMDIGADGSLEIAIQHIAPDGSQANWLPAPEGDFNLMLHMYWPGDQVLDGSWKAPPVQRVG